METRVWHICTYPDSEAKSREIFDRKKPFLMDAKQPFLKYKSIDINMK